MVDLLNSRLGAKTEQFGDKDEQTAANQAYKISVSWVSVGQGQEAYHKQLSQQIAVYQQWYCQQSRSEEDHHSEHHGSWQGIQEYQALTEHSLDGSWNHPFALVLPYSSMVWVDLASWLDFHLQECLIYHIREMKQTSELKES